MNSNHMYTHYVDFLNKAKAFQRDRKYFESYEAAKLWCFQTMDKFDPDYIKILNAPIDKAIIDGVNQLISN